MRTPDQIATRFRAINAHDDTVEGFVFHPAVRPRIKAKLVVSLFSYWNGTRRTITFNNCANIDISLDADVLSGNTPWNTAVLDASIAPAEIEALMRRHKRSWNVSYEKGIDPLISKLPAANRYVLFRVRLFGGNLLIVARSYAIKRNATNSLE